MTNFIPVGFNPGVSLFIARSLSRHDPTVDALVGSGE